MAGVERRITPQGRRAGDRAKGPPAWARVLVLGVILIFAAVTLLFTREASRPGREADALRMAAVDREARVLALELEARLVPVHVALRAGAARGGPAEQALAAARAAAPEHAFAVLDRDGDLLRTAGADASAFTTAANQTALAGDGRALLLRQTLPSGGQLVGRAMLPNLEAREGVSRWVLDGSGALIAGAAPTAQLALADRRVEANGRGVTIDGAAGAVRRTAVPVDGDRLIAAAAAPVSVGAGAIGDELWVLGGPLVVFLIAMATVVWMQRRQDRISAEWAASERRFRGAVEAARCGVWEWDIEADEVTLSENMAEMLGLDQRGIVSSETVMAQIHPQFHETVQHALQQARTFGLFEVTFAVQDAQGRVRWIDARGQARTEDGPGFGAIVGIALDTTDSRRAKAKAQAAEGRLRDGIESVSDAFALFDRKGRLILSNDGFQDAFGFDEGALRKGAFKQDLNRIAALAIKSDRPTIDGRAGAREVELQDGRWLQLTERFTSEGGSVVTAADITALKTQEAERQRVTDRLQVTVSELEDREEKLSQLARKYEVAMTRAEAANQAKSEFLANMSHELRTPLNAINGFSEIMAGELFGPLGDPKYKGYAHDILKSGQHLLSLINDILDMAKIEAGKLTLHYETVSVKSVVDEAARLMRGKVQEAGLKLVVDAPELPLVEADHRGLKQVVLNLISNAVKFTPEGGDIVVTLSQEDDERLRVAVTDTGIGIAPEDLARLARPFEQVEGQHSKTTAGTGLGLALTKSLIEMHGGELSIQSEPGRGTTVSFDLPIRRPGPVDTVQPTARAA